MKISPREAVRKFMELQKRGAEADRLLLELISHSEATDAQIIEITKARGNARSKLKEVHNTLNLFLMESGIPEWQCPKLD